jgi:arylformamidase
MGRIIDISIPLHTGMVSYPGDTVPSIKPGKQISAGDTANLSDVHLGSHTGTHVDAPHHFIDGEATVEGMALDALVGMARVLDLRGVTGAIEAEDLKAAGIGDGTPGSLRRLLLKTTNSRLWHEQGFHKDFVALGDTAADLIVDMGLRLVGNDYLSIERFHSESHYVHRRLLSAGIVILEGVDLGDVEAGDYELVCLPLKIRGGDGAPARAVLVER